jgi:hypothetical protein
VRDLVGDLRQPDARGGPQLAVPGPGAALAARLVGFGLVWIALIILRVDALRRRTTPGPAAATAEPVAARPPR